MAKSTALFDRYAHNFELLKTHGVIKAAPDISDVFGCPICLRVFPRVCLAWKNPPIRREHVPPASMGGSIRTLTCNDCNHQAGHELEHHLLKELEMQHFWSGRLDRRKDIRLEIEGVDIAAEISQTDRMFTVVASPERSDPLKYERFGQLLEEMPNRKFSFTFRGFSSWKSQIALLRIAYLYAFSALGYGFIANFQLDVVRTQIMNPNERMRETWGVMQSDFPDDCLGLNFILEPAELQSLLVIFDLSTSNDVNTRFGVALPARRNPEGDIYEWIHENQDRQFNLSLYQIPEVEIEINAEPLRWEIFGIP